MSKLNGVKTIDMVNGEITKVAYDGAEYAKVDTAFIGDLALCTDDISYFTKGEFYEVTEVDSDGDIHAIDDEGDRFHMIVADGECALFRKISDTSPTIEERVTALESDVAALKGEKVEAEPKRLTVGDVAKVVSRPSNMNGEVGDIVKIVKDDKSGWPYKCERVSDRVLLGWFYERELEAYVDETIEFEGAEYRKVDREAREGDVIVLTQEQAEDTTYVTAGKPYKVLRGPSFVNDIEQGYDVYFDDFGRTAETVDVYEVVAKPYSPKVGDVVVITANTNSSSNAVGDIGKVTVVDSDKTARVRVEGRTDIGNWTRFNDMRPATPSEIEAYEKALHKASFAVGDYVKLIKSERDNVGAIAKITDVGSFKARHVDGSISTQPFMLEYLTGKNEGGKSAGVAEWLVKATDAEIAQATAPKLKAGDFVKFKEDGADIVAGKAYELFEDCHGIYFVDDAEDPRWHHFDHEYEIVSPEEVKWAKLGLSELKSLKTRLEEAIDARSISYKE